MIKLSKALAYSGPEIIKLAAEKLLPGPDNAELRESMQIDLNDQLHKFTDQLSTTELEADQLDKAKFIAQHAVMVVMHHADVSDADEAVALVGRILRASIVEAKK